MFRSGAKAQTAITALEAYESVFAYRFKLYIEEHGFSGTGNLVVRRADFKTIGPFRGIEVAEDIDWGQRARAAGYTFVYVPEMIVFHPARESIQEYVQNGIVKFSMPLIRETKMLCGTFDGYFAPF